MHTQSNKISFNGQNFYIGLDVHRKSWQVTILSQTVHVKSFTMPPHPQVLAHLLHRDFPDGAYFSAYEAGFSGTWAHEQLIALGIHNIIIHPADVPTTQKEKVHKSDRVDSRKIALSLRAGILTPLYILSTQQLQYRSLVRTRTSLVADMTRCKQRIKSFLNFYGIYIPELFSKPHTHWSKRFMEWLHSLDITFPEGKQTLEILLQRFQQMREDLLRVTRLIQSMAQQDTFCENVQLLKSIPGIGTINAMVLLTEMGDINRFTSQQKFASYIGLVPTSSSSGEKSRNGSITFRSQHFLRKSLIESAWVAIRWDTGLLAAYGRLVKRMPPNNAIIRIAKKLTNRIYHVLKRREAYSMGQP